MYLYMFRYHLISDMKTQCTYSKDNFFPNVCTWVLLLGVRVLAMKNAESASVFLNYQFSNLCLLLLHKVHICSIAMVTAWKR